MPFPAVRRMANEVNRVERGKQRIGEIAAILPTQLAKIPRTSDVGDLALLEVDPDYAEETGRTEADVKQARKVIKQILIVREPIHQALLERQLFVAIDVLDVLIFDAALDGSSDVVFDVLKRIRDARVMRPGMLIFPVHSLGVLAAGLLQPAHARISSFDQKAGLALSPQTNSMQRTYQFLEEARVHFDVKQELPIELLKHTIENLLLSRIQAATGQIALLAALQPPTEVRAGTLLSSRIVNNWETLDIHHYLALFDTGGRRNLLDGDCVPIHASRTGVTDLTELALEIDPKYWMRYSKAHTAVRLSVEKVYEGYLRRLASTVVDDMKSRTYNRRFTALTYFRRSYRESASDFTAIVTLNTAFELMLTDSSGNIGSALRTNTAKLLKGVRGLSL